MRVSTRFALPIAGAVVLALAVLGVMLWPTPSAPPQPEDPRPASAAATVETPTPRASGAHPRQPPGATRSEPTASTPAPVPEASRNATVVPVGPGDEVPLPESPNPLPQVNDPILPEKPQTAEWRLEKTEHIRTLLARDVERLEHEKEEAAARGDEAERQRLDVLIQRHRVRLERLREHIQALSGEVGQERPER
jgi:hypothetical protein